MNDIDRQVAEKVMGWEILELGCFGTDEETERMRELEDWLDKMGIESVGTYAIDVKKDFFKVLDDGYEVWSPSTDIAAAWEVVEKILSLPAEHVDEHRHVALYFDLSLAYTCIFSSACLCHEYRGHGETAPLAICRAALKAVER